VNEYKIENLNKDINIKRECYMNIEKETYNCNVRDGKK